jgi:O-succinylbenzoate synthase
MEGWGECVAGEDPSYSAETTETAWNVLTEWVLPSVVGQEILGPEEILAPVKWIVGHLMAKACVEMAFWDLQGREGGVPLWELLGGDGEGIPVAVVVGLQPTRAALLERVGEALGRGYSLVKLKIEPGREIEIAGAARDRFPDAPLAVDANGGYRRDEGRGGTDGIAELDAMGLLFIEQPLGPRDFLGHARLQERLETPICLDESIGSMEDLLLALELGSCRAVSVKPGQVGGLAAARALEGACRARGVPARCGGMLESGIGRAHNLSLATLPGFTIAGDISESRRYWDEDLVHPELELRDGRLHPLVGAGIGVDPDLRRIDAATVRRVKVGWLE